jgi:hypothetical protein
MSLVTLFNSFYEENEKKLLMTESFPVNYTNVRSWVDALSDNGEDVKTFGLSFLSVFRHVSFTEFYENVVRGSFEVLDFALKKKRKLVLVIPGEAQKSNTWIALLVWNFISKDVVDIVEKIPFTEIRKDVLYVVVDDASYSGLQLSFEFEDRSFGEDHTVFLLVGAISKIAEERLKEVYKDLVISTNALRFDSFYNSVQGAGRSAILDLTFEQPKLLKNVFQYWEKIHAIYFDHKLADGISTLQKLIAVGIDVDGDLTNPTFRSFISGCTVEDYTYQNEKVVDLLEKNPHQMLTDFDDVGTCPRAFYKTVEYMFNGKKINPDEWIGNSFQSKSEALIF